MSNGFLVRLVPLSGAAVGVPFPGADAAFPSANLTDPQPKVVFKSTMPVGTAALFLDIDLGADTSIDTVALLFTNFTAGATWLVQGATQAAGAGAVATLAGFGAQAFGVASTTRSNPRHGFIAGTSATVRYLRIIVTETALRVMQIGVIAIGTRWLPSFNFELGAGRKITDLSDKRTLPGGEKGIWRKAKVPMFRGTWSNVVDIELLDLWSILSEVGESEPLLLIEDPDATTGQLERIHYCTIDGLDFYERAQVDKSRIDLRFEEWL